MHLEFTIPPSVNECYAGFPKRHKSDKYKQWLKLASIELAQQTKYTIKWNEWLEFNAIFFTPLYYKNWKKKKQDLDNWNKPLLDFLASNIEWFKDENVKVMKTEKKDSDLWKVKIFIREIYEV